MIYAYFDDSGTHAEAGAVTMAGYLGKCKSWKWFEKGTDQLFDREGVDVFHAKRFVDTDGDFKGWSLARKTRVAEEWFDIGKRWLICGVAVSTDRADFAAMKAKHPGVHLSAYGSCAQAILSELNKLPDVWTLIMKEGLAVVLERGVEKRENGAGQALEDVAEANGIKLRFLGTIGKMESRAVQVADYLAHFSGKQAELQTKGKLSSRSHFLDIASSRVRSRLMMKDHHRPNLDFQRLKAARLRNGR